MEIQNGSMLARPRVLEKDLSEIWRGQRFGGRLLTDGHERVKVLYPGRLNDNRGGDFRDAVIAFPGRTVKGEVELHVKSGDWRTHGHDRDPWYNGVVLHVVYARNTDGPTMLQNGSRVPILALETHVEQRCVPAPCFGIGTRMEIEDVTSILDSAGRYRFERRVTSFADQLRTAEPGQVLYRGVMEALGYSRNRGPFLALAQRLPLAALEALGGSDAEFRSRVESRLLSAAGLGSTHESAGLGWRLLRARPGNSPLVRIKAMSHLLLHHRVRGLLNGLLDCVRESPERRGFRHIEDALVVAGEEGGSSVPSCAPLGRERADDIAINVLLPFAEAFGRIDEDPVLVRKANLQYASWPRHGANCVERHILQQTGLTFRDANSAQRQQGLMELYAGMCTQGKCAACALGKPQSRHDIHVKPGSAAAHKAEIAG